jgi:thiamine-phosphate pyrophosphorylase
MLLYLITDRSALDAGPRSLELVVDLAGDAARAGVDYVQLRERDLAPRELLELTRDVRDALRGTSTLLFVNDRLDVALAAGADGVHLTTRSIPAADAKIVAPPGFLVGVSTHSAEDVRDARNGGADFVVCGPAFDTPSKRGLGAPLGPDGLASIVRTAGIPLLALGGISRDNARRALGTGAAGVAAIRLFQDAWLRDGAAGIAGVVAELRAAAPRGPHGGE